MQSYFALLKPPKKILSIKSYDVQVNHGTLTKAILFEWVFCADISPILQQDYQRVMGGFGCV